MNDMDAWEVMFAGFIVDALADADGAHDLAHIQRVVTNTKRLAKVEGADLRIVVPAAWLHDCVVVAKDSPLRKQASRLAAERAAEYLREVEYDAALIPAIEHAVAAHSFSAGIIPETVEAQVVQDADRLDSIGAIGIARCLLTGVSFGANLYSINDPFGDDGRSLDDKRYSVDHFYVKLFKLAGMMQTETGRIEAIKRTGYMKGFLEQLRGEI